MISSWENFSEPIGENYSLIASNYIHELRWWGIGSAWLDDVCISKRPYIRLDGRAMPNNCTSEDNITYIADIEGNVPGVEVELYTVSPSTNDDPERRGVKRFENDTLEWGPIKLNCTNVGMGKFYFKIGPPFNKTSEIYYGPNISICVLDTRDEFYPDQTGSNRHRFCMYLISSINATIEFSGRNNSDEPWTPTKCMEINRIKERDRFCSNSSNEFNDVYLHDWFTDHDCAGY